MLTLPQKPNILPGVTWIDQSANAHFALQFKKPKQTSFLYSLMPNFNTKASSKPDCNFRIVYNYKSDCLVIAIADSFEKIYADWTWVSSDLDLYFSELDQNDADLIHDSLYKQIEERLKYIDEMASLGSASSLQMNQMRLEFASKIPRLSNEVLIKAFPATFRLKPHKNYKGQLFLSSNYVCFDVAITDSTLNIKFQPVVLAFKDIVAIKTHSNAKKQGDYIQFDLEQESSFTFYLNQNCTEAYKTVACLSSAAMHRLVKGLESAASLENQKSVIAGDLSHTLHQKAGLFPFSKSHESLLLDQYASKVREEFEEQDFTQASILDKPKSTVVSSVESSCAIADETLDETFNYAQLNLDDVQSYKSLRKQMKEIELKRILRLSDEKIVEEMALCTFYSRNGAFYTGNVYLTTNCLHFISTFGTNGDASNESMSAPSVSWLFDTNPEPVLTISVPYSHIVLVKKQSPVSLSTISRLSVSFTGYLQLNTKNKQEIWLCCPSVKARDRLSNLILDRIKRVDWSFDQDKVVLLENHRKSLFPNSENVSLPSLSKRFQSIEIDPQESFTASSAVVEVYKESKEINSPFKVPLTVVFGALFDYEQGPILQPWSHFFDIHGKDSCMVKEYSTIRQLIVSTGGLPDVFRGEFWMLISGAWNIKLDNNYYAKLLAENSNKVSPFSQEIDKDVPRSLPEYRGYQNPEGLEALRRVLTMFSFRNPIIGYAQALNIITAVFLLFLKEQDAFLMLCNIVERFMPDHYTKTMVGSVIDQHVFACLVEQCLPSLYTHLTSNFIDLPTHTVSWFVCMYLNTISLPFSLCIVDAFLVDGPKFLFWFGLAVLETNHASLCQCKDDEQFMRCLKKFFHSFDNSNDSMEKSMEIFRNTLEKAYSFSAIVTSDLVDSLRVNLRLKTVQQMEKSYKVSQIRNICEHSVMSFEEVSLVYDIVRRVEFHRSAHDTQLIKEETIKIFEFYSQNGAWGFKFPDSLTKKGSLDPQKLWSKANIDEKGIQIQEFRKLFRKVSPWKFTVWTAGSASSFRRRRSSILEDPSWRRSSKASERTTTHLSTLQNQVKQTTIPIKVATMQDSRKNSLCSSQYEHMSLCDRIYCYSLFLHCSQSASCIVNLGSVVQVLETIMKTPLQAKLRFLFELHDIDGDNMLNGSELKDAMDTLLEMFVEKSCGVREDQFIRAVGSFLSTALKACKLTDSSVSGNLKPLSSNAEINQLDQASMLTSGDENSTLKLGFNEFLLCVMSQSVFVEFFEQMWTFQLDSNGDFDLLSLKNCL